MTDFEQLYTTEPGPAWANEDRAYKMMVGFLEERGVDTTQYGIDSFFDLFKLQCAKEIAEDVREEADNLGKDHDGELSRRLIVLAVADYVVESVTP